MSILVNGAQERAVAFICSSILVFFSFFLRWIIEGKFSFMGLSIRQHGMEDLIT